MEGLDLFSTDDPGGYAWRPALFLLQGLGEEGVLANTDHTKSFPQAILEGCWRASSGTVPTAGILIVVILTSKLSAEGVENSTWACKDCYWSLWKRFHIRLTGIVSTGFSHYKLYSTRVLFTVQTTYWKTGSYSFPLAEETRISQVLRYSTAIFYTCLPFHKVQQLQS